MIYSSESKAILDKRIKWFFLIIVLIKILVTLVFLPWIAQTAKHTYDFSNNPDFYAKIAVNLSQGIGYRIFPDTTLTMFREPGYVIFLAGIFYLFGKNYLLTRIFNIVFSLITAFFIYKIAGEARMPRNARIIAVLLFLLHPAFFIVESRLGVEGFFTMMLVITMYYMLIAQRKQNIFLFILCGVCSAVTALTRTTVIPFLIAWAIYIIVSTRQGVPIRIKAKAITAYSLMFFLFFSIWPIRNYLLSGVPIVTATVSGDSFFQGMYVNEHRSPDVSYYKVLRNSTKEQLRLLRSAGLVPQYYGFHYLYATIKEEIKHSNLMKEVVVEEYKSNPLSFLKTIILNSIFFWIRGGTTTSTTLNTMLNTPILLMTIIGICLSIKKGNHIFPILLGIFFIYFVHLPILATARHHVPTIPFLMLFSSVFISWLFQKILNRPCY
jgi:hypothetical protein